MVKDVADVLAWVTAVRGLIGNITQHSFHNRHILTIVNVLGQVTQYGIVKLLVHLGKPDHRLHHNLLYATTPISAEQPTEEEQE